MASLPIAKEATISNMAFGVCHVLINLTYMEQSVVCQMGNTRVG